ncbi:hypothetical protein RO3G_13114 [Rhizopus delemar RA 99-880]|uniref:Nucleoside diphosphate kinase n=1 Tax=Rhizopus delemar (strain RA 99-880 / ATCC MYA-4621 / FGSC 9543 / NRRL 43880) TaxID=246409 RepID=I1CIX3_RHIO9|nr:hypothetical protein RO3G_13114 [Rhizopus delemar RA 99-880]|eukprot:EIE88403.1 hypothetical protein RO3G_13114 [Rhizopus delemar RA 99-880]
MIILTPSAQSYPLSVQDPSSRWLSSNRMVIQDKTLQLSEEEVAIWYADKHEAPYYRDLVNYLTRGPIRVIVLSRVYAISGLRNLIGPTKPQPNTIRGLYGTNVQENAIHASDSKAAARREINFFF